MRRPRLPALPSPDRSTLPIMVSSTRFAPASAGSSWSVGTRSRPLASSVTRSSRSSASSIPPRYRARARIQPGARRISAPGISVALADQEAGHALGFVNPAIYQIATSSQYRQAFHDITTGNNTVTLEGVSITGYQAGPGWDPVTGWGTPDAQILIPLLAQYASN